MSICLDLDSRKYKEDWDWRDVPKSNTSKEALTTCSVCMEIYSDCTCMDDAMDDESGENFSY